MGQRTNPNIFRLGKNTEWKSKYFEKKSPELAKYAFEDSEIRRYIHKFFVDNGLMVHECRLYYTDSSLYLFVSYYLTKRSVFLIKKSNRNLRIRLRRRRGAEKRNIQKFSRFSRKLRTYAKYQRWDYRKKLVKSLTKERIVQRNLIENMRQKERSIKLRRLKVLRTFKKYRLITKHKTVKRLSMNSFSNQLLQSLSLFTHERLNIFTTFRQLDRTMKIGLNRSKTKRLKKNVALLRKFNRNDFFKEGINLMYRFAKQPDSSGLLAQFVANVLKKLKRHNFFLRFLRAALVLFSHRDFSKLGGIKIKVKGRFNGAPRARQRTIKIGNLPLLTLDSNVSYAETVSFTSNGTFGVKVWTCAGTI